jgi:simple sugar transport system ATP-binding protein
LKLFVASQPTRGVDVGAQEFIHKRIIAERDNGTPVVIVSTELDEVLALADRIAVMYRGRIIGVLPAGASRDEVGLMMAGVAPHIAHEEAEKHPSELTVSEIVAQDTAGQPAEPAPERARPGVAEQQKTVEQQEPQS